MTTVLIVDDEKGIRTGLATAIERASHRTITAASLAEARARLAETASLDCILVDIRLKDGSGLDLLREIRGGRHRDVPVIVATAYDDGERTIEAMRDGAFEYLTKPFDLPRLVATVDRATKHRSSEGTSLPAADPSLLVGRSAAMHEVWKTIGRAASSDAPVLVKGEAGVGKDLVARAIHEFSPRKDAPIVHVRVDPQAPFELVRDALLAAPPNATVRLDGLGEMPPATQGQLAAWLQSAPPLRLVAEVRLAQGQTEVPLLPELYYPLAVLEIAVPPLRDRRSDIPLLVARALSTTRAKALTEDAMAALVRHDWPGNVRELFHVVRRAAEMAQGEVIDAEGFPAELASPNSVTEPGGNRYLGLEMREAVSRLERDLIVAALRKADGNRTVAARILGIPRPQLYSKLDEHGLVGKTAKKPG